MVEYEPSRVRLDFGLNLEHILCKIPNLLLSLTFHYMTRKEVEDAFSNVFLEHRVETYENFSVLAFKGVSLCVA